MGRLSSREERYAIGEANVALQDRRRRRGRVDPAAILFAVLSLLGVIAYTVRY